MDSTEHPAASERGTFAADGFHPSPEGHRRAAAEFLRALRKRLRLAA
jgi:lysophospholipase L1-like esterase